MCTGLVARCSHKPICRTPLKNVRKCPITSGNVPKCPKISFQENPWPIDSGDFQNIRGHFRILRLQLQNVARAKRRAEKFYFFLGGGQRSENHFSYTLLKGKLSHVVPVVVYIIRRMLRTRREANGPEILDGKYFASKFASLVLSGARSNLRDITTDAHRPDAPTGMPKHFPYRFHSGQLASPFSPKLESQSQG